MRLIHGFSFLIDGCGRTPHSQAISSALYCLACQEWARISCEASSWSASRRWRNFVSQSCLPGRVLSLLRFPDAHALPLWPTSLIVFSIRTTRRIEGCCARIIFRRQMSWHWQPGTAWLTWLLKNRPSYSHHYGTKRFGIAQRGSSKSLTAEDSPGPWVILVRL